MRTACNIFVKFVQVQLPFFSCPRWRPHFARAQTAATLIVEWQQAAESAVQEGTPPKISLLHSLCLCVILPTHTHSHNMKLSPWGEKTWAEQFVLLLCRIWSKYTADNNATWFFFLCKYGGMNVYICVHIRTMLPNLARGSMRKAWLVF